MRIDVPQLIGKHERRLTGFDDKTIAMCARGMTVREIQGFLAEMYAVDVPNHFSRTFQLGRCASRFKLVPRAPQLGV